MNFATPSLCDTTLPWLNSDNHFMLLLLLSGENILNGRSKLSLSTGCLSMLTDGFREIRDEETGNEAFEVLPPSSQRLPEIISLQFLYDFIQKTKALKVGPRVSIYAQSYFLSSVLNLAIAIFGLCVCIYVQSYFIN